MNQYMYRQVSNISRTLVDNKMVDHSCRRCSNYIFILDLAPGFIGFGQRQRQDEAMDI